MTLLECISKVGNRNNHYKFIYSKSWQGFGITKFNPNETSFAYIFEYIIRVGWFQIWKWQMKTVKEINEEWGIK